MTTVQLPDVVEAFYAALPDHLRAVLRPTSAVQYRVQVAIRDQHWTPDQLAHECTRDLDTAANPAAVINDRLHVCTTIPPARTTRTGKPRTHFGCCEDGWIYDETTDPPRTIKCPGNREVTA